MKAPWKCIALSCCRVAGVAALPSSLSNSYYPHYPPHLGMLPFLPIGHAAAAAAVAAAASDAHTGAAIGATHLHTAKPLVGAIPPLQIPNHNPHDLAASLTQSPHHPLGLVGHGGASGPHTSPAELFMKSLQQPKVQQQSPQKSLHTEKNKISPSRYCWAGSATINAMWPFILCLWFRPTSNVSVGNLDNSGLPLHNGKWTWRNREGMVRWFPTIQIPFYVILLHCTESSNRRTCQRRNNPDNDIIILIILFARCKRS